MTGQMISLPRAARGLRLTVAAAALFALAACEEGTQTEGGFLTLFNPAEETTASTEGQTTKLVERDVEAPEVFSVTEAGLWDGRPSLGGVWVAHPDVTDPERVIIRNNTNNKFVIGALFRRERSLPGPRLQVSSDAAEALGMLAGAPVEINVTALRREEVVQEAEDAGIATPEVSEDTLAPVEPVAIAGAAIANAEAAEAEAGAGAEADASAAAGAAPTLAEPETAQPPKTSTLDKPYLQIGIFSVESNASNAAAQMRNAGMPAVVKKQTTKGKTFWRVLVGPAANKSERSNLLTKIKDIGFTDAYAVTN